jgi:hypothetical protein
MLHHLNRQGLNGITWALLTVIMRFTLTWMLSSVKAMASSMFENQIFDSSLLLLRLNISWILMIIICQSLYYQYILDKSHFFKSPKTFRVIITIIICCPCYMAKYVSRLEGVLHSPSGRALCLLTLVHISAYDMDSTILLYNYLQR